MESRMRFNTLLGTTVFETTGSSVATASLTIGLDDVIGFEGIWQPVCFTKFANCPDLLKSQLKTLFDRRVLFRRVASCAVGASEPGLSNARYRYESESEFGAKL